jgi:hypothetical protein
VTAHVDWSAIRTGIATLAAGGTGIGSAGASALALSTLGDLPTVKVISTGTVRINDERGGRVGAQTEARIADIVGVLLVDTAGGHGEGMWLAEPLVEQMFAVMRDGYGLGLEYVEDCWLDSADIGEVDWYGETYVGAVLRWTVKVRQTDIDRTAS